MSFGDRRQLASRARGRQLKNILFTLIMLLQVIFWVFVAFAGPSTSSKSHKQQLPIRRERDDYNKKLEVQPRPPRIIKTILNENEGDAITHRNKEIAQRVNVHNKIPRGGYAKDLSRILIDNGENQKQTAAKNNDGDYEKYYNPLLHHTILPRDASVIWQNSFLLNPKTICTRHRELDLLVIVHTAPYNFKRRAMIRQHIANKRFNLPYTVQTVFMIGSVKDEKRNDSKDAEIANEYNTQGDLVHMNFIEDFRNLSLKAVMWLRWTNEHCTNANMILKIDDDVVIDIQRILPLSRGLFSKYEKSIFCHLNRIGSQPIPRKGRTVVDPREFMRMSVYPYTYCSGFIVFLTPDIISQLDKTARKIPFYNVDDVFMFGMVPKFADGVTYHNIGYNVSIWNPKVLKCTVERGLACPYFGTMGEEEEDRLNIWSAMRRSHEHDFHFPQMRVGF